MQPAGACPLYQHDNPSTLGHIARDLGEAYLEREPLNYNQKRVFRRLAECQTAALGGALWQCRDCRRWVPVYHSCRDRHCPNCKARERAEWVQSRLGELLPIPYFHVVFTLPHTINPLVFRNPKEVLGLLFRSASQTLLQFAQDPRYLGAKPGVVMVLHTWGRKLNLHYHVHCVVTGGGFSKTGNAWTPCPRKNYLFPVRALSKVFRAIFISGLDKKFAALNKPDNLSTSVSWATFKRKLLSKKWVVYAKEPFGGPEQVLKYLGQYTNRAAISNQRILSNQNGRVIFTYKDYKDGEKLKRLNLSAEDFMHRFLLHVLPSGFHRIRYFGFLAPRNKKQALAKAHAILGKPDLKTPKPEILQEESLPGEDEEVRLCPHCKGQLLLQRTMTQLDQKRARCLLWDSS